MKNNHLIHLFNSYSLAIKISAIVLMFLSASIFTPHLSAANISAAQMTKDITYLASDKLKGRANFSPELDIAADYISQRFSDIGLKTFNGLSSYKQNFILTQIIPNKVAVSLNGEFIHPNDLAVASTMTELSWVNEHQIKTHIINKDTDFRSLLRKVNNNGGQNLILVNKVHKKLFQRYQQFFNKGLTQLNLKDPSKVAKNAQNKGAIVLVLTDQTVIENINVQVTTKLTTKSLSNVVAVLPGREKANEIVMFSAHYDHLGTTPDGTEIYNGADDDASGTTAIINLAQHFANQSIQNKSNSRTLMFAAFAAEELGGYGSRYLAQQLNPDDVIAMINIEMIGKPSKFGPGTLWMTGMERSSLSELLNQSLASHQMQIFKDPYPEQGLFYRSDNATLARLGVPAHSFSSTQLDKDQHYHQTSDDISSLDLNSMHKVIESLSIATQDLVNGKATPTRVDISKVDGQGKIF